MLSEKANFQLQPKTTLQDRYEIVDIEGYWSPSVLPDPIEKIWFDAGSEGVVYRARDLKAEGEKFVSIRHVEPTTPDLELRELTFRNLQREVDIWKKLSHAHIPPFVDFFAATDHSARYLVRDYVTGINLDTVLDSIVFATMTLHDVVRWAVELCGVIGYLHNSSPPLLFRALEPQKIMIDTQGKLFVVDFSGASTYKKGVEGALAGVDGYAAPEQYQRLHTPQSDVFSIGALLHHLLTQQDPRHFLRFSFQARRVERINPEVSEELAAVVHRALEIDPEKRFSDVSVLQWALKAVM